MKHILVLCIFIPFALTSTEPDTASITSTESSDSVIIDHTIKETFFEALTQQENTLRRRTPEITDTENNYNNGSESDSDDEQNLDSKQLLPKNTKNPEEKNSCCTSECTLL